MEAYLVDVLSRTLWQVANTLLKFWPFLLAATLVAAFLKVHMKAATVSAWLRRRTLFSVLLAVLVGATTPL